MPLLSFGPPSAGLHYTIVPCSLSIHDAPGSAHSEEQTYYGCPVTSTLQMAVLFLRHVHPQWAVRYNVHCFRTALATFYLETSTCVDKYNFNTQHTSYASPEARLAVDIASRIAKLGGEPHVITCK